MNILKSTVRSFVRGEEGATLLEYALAIALISIVAGTGAVFLGEGISNILVKTADGIKKLSP
jgi:Flp pilus assembly pilin Flp